MRVTPREFARRLAPDDAREMLEELLNAMPRETLVEVLTEKLDALALEQLVSRANAVSRWRSFITGSNRPQIRGDRHRRYSPALCALLNIIDPRVPCKHGCRWMAPYGWTRNASCPRHD